MTEKKDNNIQYILGAVAIVMAILIIVFFSYNSSKNKEAEWIEENKINSVRIIDVGIINTAEQETNACSSCKTALSLENNEGIYIDSDGTKTCSLEVGMRDFNKECDKILLSSSQSECKGGSLKLTFQINSKATNIVDCKVYNNGEMYPSDGGSYGFNSGLNVMNYAWRDYSFSPQRYKICCMGRVDEPDVCSEEYSYRNPC